MESWSDPPPRLEVARWAQERTETVLQPAGRDKPRVRRLRSSGGQRAVLKDYWECPWWLRHTVGRWVVSTERRAYQKLEGCRGIPAFWGCPDAFSLLVQYVDGRPVHRMQRGELPWVGVLQARQLIVDLERCGVSHGDIGHDSNGDFGRDANLIWGKDEQLYLFDFAGASFAQDVTLGFYRVGREHDRLLVTKLLQRFFPERTQEPEYPGLQQLSPWSRRWLRWFKKL